MRYVIIFFAQLLKRIVERQWLMLALLKDVGLNSTATSWDFRSPPSDLRLPTCFVKDHISTWILGELIKGIKMSSGVQHEPSKVVPQHTVAHAKAGRGRALRPSRKLISSAVEKTTALPRTH